MLLKILKEADGQGMVEYGLIVAGIALVVIVSIAALAPFISGVFNDVINGMA